jgi:hypothetical protein
LRDLEEISADEYRIRVLSEQEIRILIDHGYPLGFIFTPYSGNIENIYCIEKIVKVSKTYTPLQLYIEDFITALRVLKPVVLLVLTPFYITRKIGLPLGEWRLHIGTCLDVHLNISLNEKPWIFH